MIKDITFYKGSKERFDILPTKNLDDIYKISNNIREMELHLEDGTWSSDDITDKKIADNEFVTTEAFKAIKESVNLDENLSFLPIKRPGNINPLYNLKATLDNKVNLIDISNFFGEEKRVYNCSISELIEGHLYNPSNDNVYSIIKPSPRYYYLCDESVFSPMFPEQELKKGITKTYYQLNEVVDEHGKPIYVEIIGEPIIVNTPAGEKLLFTEGVSEDDDTLKIDSTRSIFGDCQAYGEGSFAVGLQTVAKGNYSFAEGDHTIADKQTIDYGQSIITGTQIYSGQEGLFSIELLENVTTGTAGGGVIKVAKNEVGKLRLSFTHQIDSFSFDTASPRTMVVTINGIDWDGQGSFVFANPPREITLTLSSNSQIEINKWTFHNVEINYNTANHAEGGYNIANGVYSHAEGFENIALSNYSHVEGLNNIAKGLSVHVEGRGNTLINDDSEGFAAHVEGFGHKDINAGLASHTEGVSGSSFVPLIDYVSYGYYKINDEEDYENIWKRYFINCIDVMPTVFMNNDTNLTNAVLTNVHTIDGEVYFDKTISTLADNEGKSGLYLWLTDGAKNVGSHAEGLGTSAIGEYSHAEGDASRAYGNSSHSEGYHTHAKGEISHSEGMETIAEGRYSHSSGLRTTAMGDASFTQGTYTVANNMGEFACGNYNQTNKSNQIFSIGIGTSETDRKNAVTVTTEGNTTFANKVITNKIQSDNGDAQSANSFAMGDVLSDSSETYSLANYMGLGNGYFKIEKVDENRYIITETPTDYQSGTITKLVYNGCLLSILGFEPFGGLYITSAQILDGDEYISLNQNLDVSSSELYITNNPYKKNVAMGNGSFAIGIETFAKEECSASIGFMNNALEKHSIAIGSQTTAAGIYSLSEGYQTISKGAASHSEGWGTIANGESSHSEGYKTQSIGAYSHSEGFETEANGQHSHAEGCQTKTVKDYAHSEGFQTIAEGQQSHAEGFKTEANGDNSHSEGEQTKATGKASHASGSNTVAMGDYSTSFGLGTETQTKGGLVCGRYNNTTDQLFVVGNGQKIGDDEPTYSDALVLDNNGNLTIAGTLSSGSDERIKDNISLISNEAIEKVSSVNFKEFNFKSDEDKTTKYGVIAQDLEKAGLNNLVSEMSNGTKTVDYISFLILKIQQLEKEIQELKKWQ